MKLSLPLLLTISGLVVAFPLSRAAHPSHKLSARRAQVKEAARPTALVTQDAAVVDSANAFLALLSDSQRNTVVLERNAKTQGRWSNLPVGFVGRNGISFGTMNKAQQTAALKIARLALGESGYTRLTEIRAADAYLGKQDRGGGPPGGFGGPPPDGFGGPPDDFGGPPPGGRPPGGFGGPGRGPGGSEYSAGNYYIAFLGKPSKTEPWLLQIGGHHLAFNIAYRGTTSHATPYFLGVEPQQWKEGNKVYAPLAPMHDSMLALLKSLTDAQREKARLPYRFNDVYVGPGRDGHFPKSEGVLVSELSATSRERVKAAINAWVGDSARAADYRKLYESELDQTRVAFSGNPNLSTQGDYVRIDGPHVWIEFACQNGIVIHNQIHFHTIWRDRVTDYSVDFSA